MHAQQIKKATKVAFFLTLKIKTSTRKGHHHQTKQLKQQDWCNKQDKALSKIKRAAYALYVSA